MDITSENQQQQDIPVASQSTSIVTRTPSSIAPIVTIEKVIFYSGLLISSQKIQQSHHEVKLWLKTYSITSSSETIEKASVDLDFNYFSLNNKVLESVDFLKIPKLDWDDRKIVHDINEDALY